jgi:hypothetical protein
MDQTPPNKCSICNKKIQSHDSKLECSLCKNAVHAKCLPYYSTADMEYAANNNNNWSCVVCLRDVFPFFNIINNDEIVNCTQNDLPIFNVNNARNLIFDPYEILDDEEDSDPDMDSYKKLDDTAGLNCDYYDIKSINNLIHKMKETNFTILQLYISIYINIRSLSKNFRMLQNTLATLDTEVDILILSETWLKPHNVDVYNLEGYTHEYVIRNKKSGGGLSFFIKNNIKYSIREDLTVNTDDIEMLWLEVKEENKVFDKNLVIGGIYRRPGVNPNIFIDALSEKLHIIKHQNKNCLYAGDFNLDLLKYKSHTPTNDFLNLNFALSYTQKINRPTRITSETATVIDNIFSNIPLSSENVNGILLSDLSDHFPIFTIFPKIRKPASTAYITKRSMSDKNKTSFKEKVEKH